ncbi:hypothetical protein AgCh_021584 [Apium graveolens]
MEDTSGFWPGVFHNDQVKTIFRRESIGVYEVEDLEVKSSNSEVNNHMEHSSDDVEYLDEVPEPQYGVVLLQGQRVPRVTFPVLGKGGLCGMASQLGAEIEQKFRH